MALTDAQYAAFIDRLIACREAEDAAKEDTKAVYAELADAGEDKTVAGLVVRQRRMTAKDRVKAELRDAAADDGHSRYLRGKASHVRAREAMPEHDADGVIIETVGAPEDEHSSHASEQTVTAHEPVVVTKAGAVAVEAPATNSPSDSPIGEEAGEAETGETLSASPANHQAETPNEVQPERDAVSSGDLWREETASDEQRPKGGEVIADRSTRPSFSQPVSEAPSLATADRSGGHLAPSSSLQAVSAPVTPSSASVTADRTKPNPWCQDPEDCGVEASWNHMCGSCLRRKNTVTAAAHQEASEGRTLQ